MVSAFKQTERQHNQIPTHTEAHNPGGAISVEQDTLQAGQRFAAPAAPALQQFNTASVAPERKAELADILEKVRRARQDYLDDVREKLPHSANAGAPESVPGPQSLSVAPGATPNLRSVHAPGSVAGPQSVAGPHSVAGPTGTLKKPLPRAAEAAEKK